MLTLSEIRGQDRVVSVLQRALRSSRVPQAYLFAGPASCGKYTTALAVAKALNCINAPNEGCSECISCQKIDQGNHPDVRVLLTEGKQKRIPIDTIRKQVVPALAMPAHEGKARVFIIEEAASMPGPTANALLKTLEEPPANTHFILGCIAPMQLLPTIRSRCQRVNFQALPVDLQVEVSGNEDAAGEIRSLSADILRIANARGLVTIIDLAKEANDRDILIAALTNVAGQCHKLSRECADAGDLDAAQIHGLRAREVLRSLQALRDHNAHGQLALEHLLVALRGMPTASPSKSGPPKPSLLKTRQPDIKRPGINKTR